MADPHATVDDLLGTEDTDGYLSQEYVALVDPDDALRLLTRASELVDGAVRQPYDVNSTTGIATDADLAAALRDATCAQVEQWVEVGEENAVDGLAGTARAVGGGVRAPELAPRAVRILSNAGLIQPVNSGQAVLA